MRDEIEAVLRKHIKCDATGLAPAVASVYLTGFKEAAAEIERLSAKSVGVNVGVEIKPGDLVNYEGDERLVRRYVGKCRRGLDVVETLHGMTSLTTWISGKARLHQSQSEVGVNVGVKIAGYGHEF